MAWVISMKSEYLQNLLDYFNRFVLYIRSKSTIKISGDAFALYIQNHNTALKFSAIIVCSLVLVKIYLYGFPGSVRTLIIMTIFCGIGSFSVMNQLGLYKKCLDEEYSSRAIVEGDVFYRLILNKLGYTIPWLLYLFWPINAVYFYDHVLGFAFVFCIIAIYPSISAPAWPLFLWDVGIHVVIILFITIYHYNIQETPVAGLVIILFSFYTGVIAWKLNRTSYELFKKKVDLQLAMENAQHAHKAKTEFLAIMSHEIRTSMNGVIGMLDFLKGMKLTKEQSRCITTIDDCSDTLINTLNDVLDYSKIEAGKFDIRPVNFNVRELMERITNLFRVRAKKEDIVFNIYIDEHVPEVIYNDPNRLQQITVNLLSNAFKFTNDGVVSLKVSFNGNQLLGSVRVEIEDTGVGISDSDQKMLFEQYSQITNADGSQNKISYQGTGLGLFISQRLVRLLGGDIGVKSKKGEGSLFWYEIPYEQPILEDENVDAILEGKHGTYSILLVDDNRLNQQIVRRYLQNRSHKVLSAHSGQDALRYLQQGHAIDAILMDLQMPDIDGIETTLQIRSQFHDYNNVPIIALTANLMADTLNKCYAAGMVDYIAKPIRKEQFFQKLYYHIEKAKSEPSINNKGAEPDDISVFSQAIEMKLEELTEEFGRDYALYVMNDHLVEVQSLISIIGLSSLSYNMNKTKQSIHDLITISGNIGLQETSRLCEEVEDRFNKSPAKMPRAMIRRLLVKARDEKMLLLSHLSKIN